MVEKIQNFVACNTRSLGSRELSGIVETTVMRKSHGWHMIRDPHLTLHLRIARCKTLLLSRCSWRCHKTSRYVFYNFAVVICFGNHSSRSRTERDQFVFGCILVPRAYDPSGLRQESRGSGSNHYEITKEITEFCQISFPEPTCLMVSTKTRSSGIINKLVPRAHVSFAFKSWYYCYFKTKFRLP